MENKISVIIPVYNVEKYIKKCLDSVVNQTFKDIEIIVVNDGSPDNSSKIIKEYMKEDKRIKYYEKDNGGQGSARNLAITKSTGEYLIFVDSDDYIDLNMLEKMYDYAKKSKLDIVVCNGYLDVNDDITNFDNFNSSINDLQKRYIVSQTGPCLKLIKAEIIKKNNLLFVENHIYEDIAIVPAYALFTDKIGYIDERFYYYVQRSNSSMNQEKYSKKLEDIFFALDNLSNKFTEYSNNKFNEELEYLYIENLLHAASLRFLRFDNYEKHIEKIVSIMKEKFPRWNKNIYYSKKGLKYKVVCNLIYKKQYKLLKQILRKS